MRGSGSNIVFISLQLVVVTRHVEYVLAVAAAGHQHLPVRDEEVLNIDNDRTRRTIGELPFFLHNPRGTSTSPRTSGLSPLSAISSPASSSLSSLSPGSRLPWLREAIALEQDAAAERKHESASPRITTDMLALSSKLTMATKSACKLCVRKRREVAVGYDMTGQKIFVDVGQCRLKRRKKARNPGPSRDQCNRCDQDMCVPSITHLKRTHYPLGNHDVSVIVNCTCRERPPPICERRPKRVIFMQHSPFETTVDIGSCEGGCAEDDADFGCRPIRNKSVALKGPNGARIIDTIQECSCTASCYRAKRMESTYAVTWNSTTNQTQVTSMYVDIGMCVGKCAPSNVCVFETDGICSMYLLSTSNICQPKSWHEHSFVLPNGRQSIIYSIADCLCSSSSKELS